MVIKKQKLIDCALQHGSIVNLPTVERLFQRSEESLDPAIHPRTPKSRELLPDAAEAKRRPEQAGFEHGFVI